MTVAGDHFYQALAFLQRVNDRRARHAKHAQIGVLLASFQYQALYQSLALAHHHTGIALLGVVNFVDNNEVHVVQV